MGIVGQFLWGLSQQIPTGQKNDIHLFKTPHEEYKHHSCTEGRLLGNFHEQFKRIYALFSGHQDRGVGKKYPVLTEPAHLESILIFFHGRAPLSSDWSPTEIRILLTCDPQFWGILVALWSPQGGTCQQMGAEV